MKKLALLSLAVCLASAAHGSILTVGTSELGLSGSLDFDGSAGTETDLNIFYGYFIEDYLEAGVDFQIFNNDDYTVWSLGPMLEYNFDLGIELVPYTGAGFAYASVDGPGDEDKSALVVGLEGGAKYFITEYFALSMALAVQVATDDIFPGDPDPDNNDVRIVLGARTFF